MDGTAGEMARLINETGVMGKSFKATAKNVKEVPFDKMIEAIHKVQENMGITGTTSLEASETIQGSVNSMKSSWKNLLTAVADNNQDMRQSVKRFTDSTITASKNIVPRIRIAVDGIKKLVNGLIKQVFPKLKREIPELRPLIGIFEWFIKNRRLVVGAVGAMVGAFTVKKIFSFTKVISDGAKGLLLIVKNMALATTATIANTGAETANTAGKVVATAATGALTTAQMALNAAWKSNPIGLVITGVTALVAIFGVLKGITNKQTDAENKQNEAMQKSIDTLDDYKEAMQEADEAKQEYLDKNLSEIDYYERLHNELNDIVDANGKVKAGYEDRAKFIVSTLNEALGTEIKMTDGVISNYEKLEDSIKKVIEQKRAQTLIEANEGKYNEARDQKIKLEEAYSQILSQNTEKEKTRNQALQEMADYLEIDVEELKKFIKENGEIDVQPLREYYNSVKDNTYGMNNLNNIMGRVDFMNLKIQVRETTKAFYENENTLKSARTEYNNNQKTINDYENALTNLQNKNYEAVSSIYEDTHNFLGETTDDTYNNYQKQIDMQIDYIQELNANKDKYDKSYIESETKKSESVIKNLAKEQSQYRSKTEEGQKQIKGVWNQGMRDLLRDIAGKDIEFRKTADGNIQMYQNGIAQGKPMAEKEAKRVADGIIKELNNAKNEGKIAGINLIKGVDNGINYQKGSAFSTIRGFGSTLLSNLKLSLKERSPSKATEEDGVNLLLGLIKGIKKQENPVLRQVTKFGKSVIGSLNTGLSENVNMSAINDIQSSIPSEYSAKSINSTNYSSSNNMVNAFKEALSQMTVEMDDEAMGKFVDKTVAKAIYT